MMTLINQRCISFRGKRINGEWVYGLIARKDGKFYISNLDGQPFAYEIYPDTLGQMSRWMSKDYKNIYEGDIILDQFGRKLIVCFNKNGFALSFSNVLDYNSFIPSESLINNARVIGTIYDKGVIIFD